LSDLLKITVAAATLTLALATQAAAQSSSVAVGANIGTPGVGAQIQLQASDSVVLRADADWLSFSRDESYSGVDYDGKIKSTTGGVFADWHPGQGAFLVSAGAYYGQRKLRLRAQPNSDVTIGGQNFTPAQVGMIEGDAKLSKAQPFLGVGWDNTFTNEGGWGFRALAGVSFGDEPSVNLRSVGGTFSGDANFQARLRQEEAEVREDAKKYRYYPIVQVGVTRRF
jgi:hypothetical protein